MIEYKVGGYVESPCFCRGNSFGFSGYFSSFDDFLAYVHNFLIDYFKNDYWKGREFSCYFSIYEVKNKFSCDRDFLVDDFCYDNFMFSSNSVPVKISV